MEVEGVIFRPSVNVGVDVLVDRLLDNYDLLVLAAGAEATRDRDVPGRELGGIHFAMDFLGQQNRRVAGDEEARAAPAGTISAAGKHVLVIGGGGDGQPDELRADLVLLAMGFVGADARAALQQAGVAMTARGTVDATMENTAPATRASTRAATCGAANRSSYGRSARDAIAPAR